MNPRPTDGNAELDSVRQRLNMLTQKTLALANPTIIPRPSGESEFVKYTPAAGAATSETAPGVGQRIIKLTEMPIDPLQPAKYKNRKEAILDKSPPPPILRSPPRKLTAQQIDEWKIPPSISNWKNPKGYTIALDKRLAADASRLADHSVNDRFADFSSALYLAERKAAENVNINAQLRKKEALLKKEQHEKELADLAMRVRRQRQGIDDAAATDLGPPNEPQSSRSSRWDSRAAERDVSGEIRLGEAVKQIPDQKIDSIYDTRLFSKAAAAGSHASSEHHDEGAYSIYDTPLFADRSQAKLYKGRQNPEFEREADLARLQAQRFVPETHHRTDNAATGGGAAAAADGAAEDVSRDAAGDAFGMAALFPNSEGARDRPSRPPPPVAPPAAAPRMRSRSRSREYRQRHRSPVGSPVRDGSPIRARRRRSRTPSRSPIRARRSRRW